MAEVLHHAAALVQATFIGGTRPDRFAPLKYVFEAKPPQSPISAAATEAWAHVRF